MTKIFVIAFILSATQSTRKFESHSDLQSVRKLDTIGSRFKDDVHPLEKETSKNFLEHESDIGRGASVKDLWASQNKRVPSPPIRQSSVKQKLNFTDLLSTNNKTGPFTVKDIYDFAISDFDEEQKSLSEFTIKTTMNDSKVTRDSIKSIIANNSALSKLMSRKTVLLKDALKTPNSRDDLPEGFGAENHIII